MATLLLELFSEEIPSRMQRGAAEQLERLMVAGFEKNMLAPTGYKTFVSPRHLAIQCFGLPLLQPDTREEKRGPKIGAPEQAMKGFLQSTGLTLEQCEQRDGYYYATIERKGRAVADVVKEICESTLAAFGWPKSMRWGAHSLAWVRPLHRIACLLDDAVVPVQFAHLTASNITEGHRFLAPAPITITHAEQYESLLRDAKVVVDYAARRAQIKTDIAALAATAHLSVSHDEALLDEVTGLVEWPVPLLCQFDKKFLELPPEVLISEMKNHQRYFALKSADGALSDQFITVANMVNADGGVKVKAGNARVVRARLADGEFYWEQDRKVSLEDWGKKLSDVVFHAKVGMMDEKVKRIEALAVQIATAVGYEKDIELVKQSARLCKADLTSGMVGEFPELQGIMGRYYAKHEEKHVVVAEAIYEHYKPQGANDTPPESEVAAIISIADKLDSIISLFAAGEKPTGSKDPLALRRAALGVLRIILQRNWKIDLKTLGASDEVIAFFIDRLKVMLRDEGHKSDVIEAVLARQFTPPRSGLNQADMLWHSKCVKSYSDWATKPIADKAITSLKRVYNLLAAEEKKSAAKYTYTDDNVKALALPAEQKLILELNSAFHLPAGPWLRGISDLQPAIDNFFDSVLVTEPTMREARLSLLSGVREYANSIADFSKIEG